MAKRLTHYDKCALRLNDEGDSLGFFDMAQNVFVTGVTGGGKTSGPGRHYLRLMARSGAGGVILCAKPGEADEVRELFAQEGREQSLIFWNGRNQGFNFLAYTLARLGRDGINSLTEYFMRVIEMIRGASALQGSNGDAFWLDALRVLLRYSLLILYYARGTFRISELMAFMRSAPTAPEQFRDAAWRKSSFFYQCLLEASPHIESETLERILSYWNDDFAKMEPKLRGNILAGFALLDRFNHGWLKDALCGDTTLVPELCFNGAVIVIDTSRATMGEDGVILQMIFKDAWQTAVLARNGLHPAFHWRFAFCYADECQEVVTSRDADFLAMSRSSFAGTIYLTQSIPTIIAKLGGQNARDRAYHLIGNFGIRIFCANSCAETNEYGSRTIGKVLQHRSGYSHNKGTSSQYGMNMGEGTNWGVSSNSGSSYSSGANGASSYGSNSSSGTSSGGNDSWGRNRGGGSNHGETWSQNEQMDFVIEAGAFGRMLKTGGPANDNRVSAIVYQASRVFRASGGNAVLVEFQQ